jgi:hypothetical protein
VLLSIGAAHATRLQVMSSAMMDVSSATTAMRVISLSRSALVVMAC